MHDTQSGVKDSRRCHAIRYFQMKNTGPCCPPNFRLDEMICYFTVDPWLCALLYTMLSLAKEMHGSENRFADNCQTDRSNFEILARKKCSSRYQIPRFKVKAKSYNASSPTTERRRAKIARNSQHSKTSNVILLTYSSSETEEGGVLKHAIW